MPAYTELPAQLIEFREGDSPLLMNRVLLAGGSYLSQAMLTGGAIEYWIFDQRSATPRTAIQNGTLAVSGVIYDTLQLFPSPEGNLWTADTIGCNFAWQAPADYFTISEDGDGLFNLFVQGQPAAGPEFWIAVFQCTVFEMLPIS